MTRDEGEKKAEKEGNENEGHGAHACGPPRTNRAGAAQMRPTVHKWDQRGTNAADGASMRRTTHEGVGVTWGPRTTPLAGGLKSRPGWTRNPAEGPAAACERDHQCGSAKSPPPDKPPYEQNMCCRRPTSLECVHRHLLTRLSLGSQFLQPPHHKHKQIE
jgi:hypothetical protein